MSRTWLCKRATAVRYIRVVKRDTPTINLSDLSYKPFFGPGGNGGKGSVDIVKGSNTCRECVRRCRKFERVVTMSSEGIGWS